MIIFHSGQLVRGKKGTHLFYEFIANIESSFAVYSFCDEFSRTIFPSAQYLENSPFDLEKLVSDRVMNNPSRMPLYR